MSGTILVDDETRQIERTTVLTETLSDDRSVRLAERYLVDTNMLQSLPSFVSYIFTPSEPPRPSLISPIKVKKETLIFHVVESGSVERRTSLDLPNDNNDIQLLSDEPSEHSEPLENNSIIEHDTLSSSNKSSITSLYLPIASYYFPVLPFLEHNNPSHDCDENNQEIENDASLLFDESDFDFFTSEEANETTNEQSVDELMGLL
nr:hypothetical protein BEI47_15505 [Aliivibrio fischeri]